MIHAKELVTSLTFALLTFLSNMNKYHLHRQVKHHPSNLQTVVKE